LKELTVDIFLQLIVILVCLFYGARKGGVALGLPGGIGLVIMVFVFGLKPGKPPVNVMLTIIAVVAASATLQASGGPEVMLKGAEKLLRRNPKVHLDPGAVCDLFPDYFVWYRPRGLHHAAVLLASASGLI
jgi:anaerobic C4-dicarboxylate transporter